MTIPSLDATDKVVVVTGGSKGLGRAMALGFAEAGADVVVASRKLKPCEEVAAEIRTRGRRALAVRCHVADWDDCAGLVDATVAEFGRIDVLVNNAGIETTQRPDEVSLDDLAALTDVNLLAPMVLTRMALPGMVERDRGHIVNVSSVAGLIAVAYQEPYNATKFGLVGFTRALRLSAQDRGWGVSASAVCPGFMSGAGMFDDMQNEFGVTAPKVAGELPVELVGDAVVKAITKDLPEVIVMKGAPRIMWVASNAVPRAFERIVGKLNLAAPFRTMADQRSRT
jgi:NAD(P)-dependent dehydrogenase (short-subunit alcohol dehydrogenase family)